MQPLLKIDFVADSFNTLWNKADDVKYFNVEDYIDPETHRWRMEINIEVALPTSGSILLCSQISALEFVLNLV